MARKKKVAIEHKELGLTSEVLEASLPAWIRGGWTLVDDGGSDEGQVELTFFEYAQNDVPGDPDADEE